MGMTTWSDRVRTSRVYAPIVLLVAVAAAGCGTKDQAAAYSSSRADSAQIRDSIQVRGAEDEGNLDGSGFALPVQLEQALYRRDGSRWVAAGSFAPDLTIYTDPQTKRVAAVAFVPPHRDGEEPPRFRYFFDPTRVEMSWRDGQNGCAESATVKLRWKLAGDSVVGASRQVHDQDGGQVSASSCALGQGDAATIATSWPALQRRIGFSGP